MKKYKDKTGKQIKVGNVLIYNEGAGFGQSIEEVVKHEGELASVMRVGEPKWTVLENQEPMPLEFYKAFPEYSENITIDATVSSVNPIDAFTSEYAASIFYGKAEPL